MPKRELSLSIICPTLRHHGGQTISQCNYREYRAVRFYFLFSPATLTCQPYREKGRIYTVKKRLGCVDCGFKKRSPHAVVVARKLSKFWIVLEKK